MRHLALLFLLTFLAACATPQEACIARATKDLRAVNELIATTEANLARGYAIEQEAYTSFESYQCNVEIGTKDGPRVITKWCHRPATRYRDKAVSIDPAAERRKLAGLKTKRTELIAQARREVAACKAAYPEE